MDEWQLEMTEIRRQLQHLRETDGDPRFVEELEAELRILQSLYRSAWELFEEGEDDADLRRDFSATGMGEWSFRNVYSFVYETALTVDTGTRELASIIPELDYPDLVRQAAG